MLKTRVIPTLLLKQGGLYKGRSFKNHSYVGDPLNAIRIFNEKEVDELILLDIEATPKNREPNFEALKDFASEAFMPMAYGGGIKSVTHMERIFEIGFEKVVINSAYIKNPELIQQAASVYGSQSIVISIDTHIGFLGKRHVYINSGKARIKVDPIKIVSQAIRDGVGEVMLTSIDRDGTMSGFDLPMIERVASNCSVPLIASGGAGSLADFKSAKKAGADAVAAGAFFVYNGPHRAVLISYPQYADLEALFNEAP